MHVDSRTQTPYTHYMHTHAHTPSHTNDHSISVDTTHENSKLTPTDTITQLGIYTNTHT